MSLSIVFHHPHPITEDGVSGSQVRPYRMLEAFRSVGFEVETVAGRMADRRRTVERIRREVDGGRRFAFAYAENSTMPTLLTERHHVPIHPFLDFGFFRWLRRMDVPTGLYYRDIHWRFDQYRQNVAWHKRAVAIPFYLHEWSQYRRWISHLFLPSLRMLDVLPTRWPRGRVSALPPGCHPIAGSRVENDGDTPGHLKLLYIGGVTPPLYDMSPMFDVVHELEGIGLTVCCRESEWQNCRVHYSERLGVPVRVIHASGEELLPEYAAASAFVLLWKQNRYLDFAVPVKLMESLGYGLPVITLAGTEAARWVELEGTGWVVRTKSELLALFERLRDDPRLLAEKRLKVVAAQERNTWRTRALQVATTLAAEKIEVEAP